MFVVQQHFLNNMEKFKGTPGPWAMAGKSISGGNHFKVIGTALGGKFKVARAPFHDYGEGLKGETEKDIKEAQANAVLIAASPELLQATQLLVSALEYMYGEFSRSVWSDKRHDLDVALSKGREVIYKALNTENHV